MLGHSLFQQGDIESAYVSQFQQITGSAVLALAILSDADSLNNGMDRTKHALYRANRNGCDLVALDKAARTHLRVGRGLLLAPRNNAFSTAALA